LEITSAGHQWHEHKPCSLRVIHRPISKSSPANSPENDAPPEPSAQEQLLDAAKQADAELAAWVMFLATRSQFQVSKFESMFSPRFLYGSEDACGSHQGLICHTPLKAPPTSRWCRLLSAASICT